MPVISVGNNSLRIISKEPEFDPQNGYSTRYVYEGSERSCHALMAEAELQKCFGRAYQVAGPVWRAELRISSGDVPNADEVQEQWTFSKEFVQVDMRNHPNLLAAYNNDPETLNLSFKTIDDAIKNGTGGSSIPAGIDTDVYILRSFGVKAFEVERLILRRRITYAAQATPSATLEAIPSIYTTAALIRDFNIPAGVANRLPANPTVTPTGFVWGWKRRVDETDIQPRVNKTTEQTDWVFAAWPALIYTVVS